MTEKDAIAEWLGEHGYLIMACYGREKIGSIQHPAQAFTGEAKSIGQPFVITRESTEAEYMEQCKWIRQRIGADTKIQGGTYYYEIRTD